MDLAKILTDLNGNAEIWLLANSYFLFLVCMCPHLFFVHSLPIFLLHNVSLFSSSLSTDFFYLFCMPLPSVAWHGDWKPPKVWRNCKSQKQPAQQPCKSSRNCKNKKKAALLIFSSWRTYLICTIFSTLAWNCWISVISALLNLNTPILALNATTTSIHVVTLVLIFKWHFNKNEFHSLSILDLWFRYFPLSWPQSFRTFTWLVWMIVVSEHQRPAQFYITITNCVSVVTCLFF